MARHRIVQDSDIQRLIPAPVILLAVGKRASIPSDLGLGQMYFATDTGELFFGTPSVGVGYVQIGDTRNMNETLNRILLELKAVRLALIALACEGGRAVPGDFEPKTIASDAEIVNETN